jgi:hypothetical protein
MTGGIVLSCAYGIEIKSLNDPFIQLGEQVMKNVVLAARPGFYMVDMLPWLKFVPKWFPGAQFQRDAEFYSIANTALPNVTLEEVKHAMVSSSHISCYSGY